MARWRWDTFTTRCFRIRVSTRSAAAPAPQPIGANGGDWSTVNVGPVATASPTISSRVPGYRQIVDLSPANDSRFLDAVGEAGHFLSPHYDDFLADWQAVRHRQMRMTRAEVDAGAIGDGETEALRSSASLKARLSTCGPTRSALTRPIRIA